VIGYIGEPFDFEDDLPFAESLVSAILDKKDPWRGRAGALRLAYRSGVDKTLQPFRLYIPPKFKAGKSNPLVVLLHGAGGDENTYFGPFAGDALLKRAADRRMFLVSPRGRGPVGGYVKDSAQDVLDVTRLVSEQFNIDPGLVYLTGHSMGAMGAFSLGFNNPGVFRAIAPCAGVPTGAPAGPLLAKAPGLPVLLTQGGRDALVRSEVARRFADEARKSLTSFEYKEFPGADHFSIGLAALSETLDFFQSLAASTPKR
jgi:predicted esterase